LGKLLTRQGIMTKYGVSMNATFRWQRNGCPVHRSFIGQASRVYFDEEQVHAWLEERRKKISEDRAKAIVERMERARVARKYFVDYPDREV